MLKSREKIIQKVGYFTTLRKVGRYGGKNFGMSRQDRRSLDGYPCAVLFYLRQG